MRPYGTHSLMNWLIAHCTLMALNSAQMKESKMHVLIILTLTRHRDEFSTGTVQHFHSVHKELNWTELNWHKDRLHFNFCQRFYHRPCAERYFSNPKWRLPNELPRIPLVARLCCGYGVHIAPFKFSTVPSKDELRLAGVIPCQQNT